MRTGDWFCTFTGVQFYLTDPHPDDVRIEDIAHALSMICRFGGHTSRFYSVAQHLLICAAQSGDPVLRVHLLMHDAAEAYINDMVRPLKLAFPAFKELELRMMDAIYKGLDLPPPTEEQHHQTKLVDDRVLMSERENFMKYHGNGQWSTEHIKPVEGLVIEPMPPFFAELTFLETYRQLCAAANL